MKKFILKLFAPLVALWIHSVDVESEKDTADEQPDPLHMSGFDAGIPTG